jgi:hypothetical protein
VQCIAEVAENLRNRFVRDRACAGEAVFKRPKFEVLSNPRFDSGAR